MARPLGSEHRDGQASADRAEHAGIRGYDLDLDLKPRLATKTLADGGEIFRKVGGKWISLLKYGQEDSLNTGTIGIEGTGKTALMQSSVGRDKSALVRVDLTTGKTTVLGASDQADVETVWTEPRMHTPQAYTVNYLKPEITVLSPAVKKDVDLLTKELGDGFKVTNRSLDDNFWTVTADDALTPASSYLYDRKAGKLTKLFDNRPALAKAPLVPMQSLEIKARDGLTLVSYLSLPPGSDANGDGVPESPVPLVLNVHGGPWGRDDYGFDNEHQWLANRGYAVLSVNYRGSTGFGKAFVNASNKEWAGKMHDDLLDAVDWAVKQKVTTKDKVAIYGGSYGGYATLVGVTFTPDTFACGVDIVGPSNLQTSAVDDSAVLEELLRGVRHAGRRSADRGREEVVSRTLAAVARRRHQEAAVDRAGRERSARTQGRSRPDRDVHEGEESAGDLRPVSRRGSRLRAARQSHLFLCHRGRIPLRCLGGRYEPVGNDFKDASLQVLEGAEYVPGLVEALK
jgi:acetyl esterase/lipase